MNLVTHLSFGLLLTFLIYTAINPHISQQTLNLYLITAAVGSILPDLDHPKAYISKKHWMLHGTARLIEIAAPHRGLTHSLLGLMVVSATALAGLHYLNLNVYLVIPLAIGYLSHLLADSLNPTGVKWLQPISQWTLKFEKKVLFLKVKINTGSITERLIGTATGLLFLYLYLNRYGQGGF